MVYYILHFMVTLMIYDKNKEGESQNFHPLYYIEQLIIILPS